MKNFYKQLILSPILNIFIAIFIFNTLILIWINYIEYDFKLRLVEYIFIELFYIIGVENLLFFLLWIFFRKFLKKISYFLLAIFSLFFIFESFLLLKFYTEFNVFILDAIVHTNLNEISEFGNSFIDIKSFLIILATILILFFSFKVKPLEFNKKNYIIFLIIFFVSICFSIGKTFLKYKEGDDYFNRINKSAIFRIFYVNISYFSNKSNTINLDEVINFYEKHYSKNLKLNLYLEDKNLPKNIVFIIGESSQRNYMSIYSYPINTTPNLKNLQASSNLIAFNNTVCPFTSTNPSLQRVLNFSSYDQEKLWFDSLNMVDMFKIRGYKTAWFSNQEKFGVFSGAATSVSMRADISKFSSYLQRNISVYDEILLDLFNNFNSDKNFYVFHLMGSHLKYEFRYPNNFDKFGKIDLNLPLNNKEKKILRYYLNTIYYNDFIVNEIYELFKDEDSLIIYLSDHGESIFEQNGLVGHGGIFNRFVCEIPLIFIGSNEFISKHSDIWHALEKARDKPFMSDDIIHTMADIIKFYPEEFMATKSLLRDEFDTTRKRIVDGKDYEGVRHQIPYRD
ncbi:phosphoethanolamine transferase [Campylobacter sp. RM16192]|uniref:phosphoethanolamine transferase n=1 Tax=Campylobacter sp. RM16192 TaxID=1660080 RepID=UPI00145214AB|nr:phosphoethanolamine transferase [Campylobacter sp. RM16192]QCD53339.1 phosphoethanolamine transferase [Campylobacter sp. RM16192]